MFRMECFIRNHSKNILIGEPFGKKKEILEAIIFFKHMAFIFI